MKRAKRQRVYGFPSKNNGVKIIGFEKDLKRHTLNIYGTNTLKERYLSLAINYTGEENWADFALYHELFHAIDPNLPEFPNASDLSIEALHKAEFFADFAACLYMASKGVDMFLDAAKMRALSLQTPEHKGVKENFNETMFIHGNHHIYTIFKKEKIDPIGMSIQDIVTLTTKLTEEYAFNATELEGLNKFREDISLENANRRINRIMNGTIAKGLEYYRD